MQVYINLERVLILEEIVTIDRFASDKRVSSRIELAPRV